MSVTTAIAKQLLSDSKKELIDKDALLEACLEELEKISESRLYDIAIDEGFIGAVEEENEEAEDKDLRKLSASQRIIERVLSRYGD